MDFKAALEAIKKVDNGADLVSAIEAEVTRLETKSFETIGENRKATAKARTLSEAMEAVAKILGIEGDAEAIATAIEPKIRALTSELSSAKDEKGKLETRATEAEGKVKTFERQSKVSDIAAKAGASAKALEKLLGDRLDELKIDGDIVKIGDKPLKEYVEADETLKDFIPALFPSPGKQGETKTTPKLPSGSPKTGSDKKDLLSKYAERNYGGAKALTKTKEAVDG